MQSTTRCRSPRVCHTRAAPVRPPPPAWLLPPLPAQSAATKIYGTSQGVLPCRDCDCQKPLMRTAARCSAAQLGPGAPCPPRPMPSQPPLPPSPVQSCTTATTSQPWRRRPPSSPSLATAVPAPTTGRRPPLALGQSQSSRQSMCEQPAWLPKTPPGLGNPWEVRTALCQAPVRQGSLGRRGCRAADPRQLKPNQHTLNSKQRALDCRSAVRPTALCQTLEPARAAAIFGSVRVHLASCTPTRCQRGCCAAGTLAY